MIEICFNRGIQGFLNLNKTLLGSEDVIEFPFFLNYGKLDGDFPENHIRKSFDFFKYTYENITDKKVEKWTKAELKKIQKNFLRVQEHFKSSKEFRIWIGNSAEGKCGLYWFCNYFKAFENKIYVVVSRNGYDHFENTSECNDAKELTAKEKSLCADLWTELEQENAPLRLLIDNRVVSVSEDFIDSMILDYIIETPQTQSNVMYNIVSRCLVTDINYFAMRIQKMIDSGKIKVCEYKTDEHGNFWKRTICCPK